MRDFLEKKYPKDSLPTVDEARALAAAHRAAMELFSKNEERAAREATAKQRREELLRKQQPRRLTVEQEAKGLADRQRQARQEFSRTAEAGAHGVPAGLFAGEPAHPARPRRAPADRALRPSSAAITGVELITKKIHEYRDATRYKLFLAQKKELADRQQREAAALDRRQQLETLTMQRRLHALDRVEKRELRSLETTLTEGAPDRGSRADGPRAAAARAGAHMYG